MQALFILNVAPYGSELTHNGLRLAAALAKRGHNTVRIYLMGDAVGTAKSGPKLSEGQPNLQTILGRIGTTSQDNIGVCGGCMDARALQDGELIDGAHRGTIEQLADWSEWADKVFVF
ncbi:DsrE family protein [Pollutimonas sp. H1-120]|uniref:DsrE/DsrF/TusD sulfur relay family protein n=1 Tax=Pollutimonas sp. H1-120 TaxID=3148824 RepID=UPI003B524A1F